jgi:hypothetical protein
MWLSKSIRCSLFRLVRPCTRLCVPALGSVSETVARLGRRARCETLLGRRARCATATVGGFDTHGASLTPPLWTGRRYAAPAAARHMHGGAHRVHPGATEALRRGRLRSGGVIADLSLSDTRPAHAAPLPSIVPTIGCYFSSVLASVCFQRTSQPRRCRCGRHLQPRRRRASSTRWRRSWRRRTNGSSTKAHIDGSGGRYDDAQPTGASPRAAPLFVRAEICFCAVANCSEVPAQWL